MGWVKRNGSLVYVDRGLGWYAGVGCLVMLALAASCSMCMKSVHESTAKQDKKENTARVPEAERPLKIGRLYVIDRGTVGFPTKEASSAFYESIRIGDRQGAAVDALGAGAEVIEDRKVRVLEQSLWHELALVRVSNGNKLWVKRRTLSGEGE